jgi:hypothetical protein
MIFPDSFHLIIGQNDLHVKSRNARARMSGDNPSKHGSFVEVKSTEAYVSKSKSVKLSRCVPHSSFSVENQPETDHVPR